MPNVGKSTLISAISSARPKIADYPFTTLEPSLGVVLVDDTRRVVVADIPGLIPGAHLGKGLGIQFLKHIERTKALVHLIDISQSYIDVEDKEAIKKEALSQFEAIEEELNAFSPDLMLKKRIVVFSKLDLPLQEVAFSVCKEEFRKRGFEILGISTVTNIGIQEFKQAMAAMIAV